MPFWDTDPEYFLYFFIPGFIMLNFYNWLRKSLPPAQEQKDVPLYMCLGYSGIYCFFWYPMILYLSAIGFNQGHKYPFYIFLTFLFIAVPFAIPVGYLKTNTKIRTYVYDTESPSIRPWDCVFKELEPCYVRVYLKDGNVIGGKYSDKSFASAYPYNEQIYLEEIWILDESYDFQTALPGSRGMIILNDRMCLAG
jgi:hypothetical protein